MGLLSPVHQIQKKEIKIQIKYELVNCLAVDFQPSAVEIPTQGLLPNQYQSA
jgi:hypothetical protein